MTTSPIDSAATTARPTSARQRVSALARANLRLLSRNRLTLSYAFIMPLLPLSLALIGSGSPTDQQAVQSVGACLLTALLFSTFYSVLSSTVTRRDELVLKRLRTGESTDVEIVTAMVIPGTIIVLGVTLLVMAVSPAVGLPLPDQPVVLMLGALVAALCFAMLGLWTAAWTANAEAAQSTCLPVFTLGFAGMFASLMPDNVRQVLEFTPGAAVMDLLRATWVSLPDAPLAQPLLVLLVWSVAAVALAAHSMRWEPRV